jgi:hypothetical protein
MDDDVELLVSSCSGHFSKKQLPSSFLLVTYGQMHGKRSATMGRLGLDLLCLEGEALGLYVSLTS